MPKIFANYSHCPMDRDTGDYGSLYDKYIFMSYVECQSLDKTWEVYGSVIKGVELPTS